MDLIKATHLPVFFHCRNAFPEFLDIVTRHRDSIPGGVVSQPFIHSLSFGENQIFC